MADGELNIELVPDQEALENIEEKQLEISGEPDAVGEATELNEEQNQKLSVISRGIGRIASRLGILTVIAATLAALARILGDVLNISFQDLRDAISTAINQLMETISNIIGRLVGGPARAIGNATSVPANQIGGSLGAGLGLLLGGIPGALAGAEGGQEFGQSNNGPGGAGSQTIQLFTSRDMLTGDSTQQEMDSQNLEDFIINGGS